jgi:hypothetical protein
MPFDQDEEFVDTNKKTGLKSVSSRKSIFDNIPKKPTQQDFQKKVESVQEKINSNKQKAADLALEFKKILEDKTLPQNKNVFSKEIEREVLTKMVQLAVDINNDPDEADGMGSLSWITLLLKIALAQRDRINTLEYNLHLLDKKIDNSFEKISKELKDLDKEKKNE